MAEEAVTSIDWDAILENNEPAEPPAVPQEPAATPEETPAATPETPPPATITNPQLEELQREIAVLQNAQFEVNARNKILESLVRERPAAQAPIPAAPQAPSIDEEAFVAQFRANPAKAIVGLVQQAAAQVVDQKVGTLKADTVQAAEAQAVNSQRQYEDKQRTISTFGAYFNNPEFVQMAEQCYASATQGQWRPDSMYNATAAAYGILVNAGKLKPASAGNVVQLSERRPKPADPLTTGKTTTNAAANEELDLSPRELAGLAKIATELGISRESALKRYLDERKADKLYGSGR
jgi:hypothetical protein